MVAEKPYSLKKICENKYLVLGNDYTRVGEFLPILNEELKEKKFTGDLVFDLLLSNGNNASRFFTAHFDGCLVNVKSLKKTSNLDPNIIYKATQYFISHKVLLVDSVLTRREIERIIASF